MNEKEKELNREARKLIDKIFGLDRADIKKDINASSRAARAIIDKLLKQSKASLEEWVNGLTILELLELFIAIQNRLERIK